MKSYIKEYPHYNNLPQALKLNLNLLRYYLVEYDDTFYGMYEVNYQDLEFLDLEALLEWVKKELPDFDTDFLEASARIHKETYEDGLFDNFLVEEQDLFDEFLHIKDAYELKLSMSL